VKVVGHAGWGCQSNSPTKAADGVLAKILTALQPDVFVGGGLMAAILRQNLLAVPKLGAWNLHASLLPKYRGRRPIPMGRDPRREQDGAYV